MGRRILAAVAAAALLAACKSSGGECESCDRDKDCKAGMSCGLFTGGGDSAILCGYRGTVCRCSGPPGAVTCEVLTSGAPRPPGPVTCVPDQPCSTPTSGPCQEYRTRCASTYAQPTCELVGDRPEGTACGGERYCAAGTCLPPTLLAIDVQPASPQLETGSTRQLTASGRYSAGPAQPISTSVIWSSSDPAVAEVGPTGLAAARSPGSCVISAALGAVAGSTPVQVIAPTLLSIAVTPAHPRVLLGSSLQLGATGTYSSGPGQIISASVTWASSDTAVASVDPSGLAVALAPGVTTISAVAGGVTGSTSLTVPAPPSPPQGVSAVPGEGSVTIRWDPVPGATTHALYWSTSAGVSKLTGTRVAGVSSPHTHSGLTYGPTYHYVVTAASADGEGAGSLEVWAAPLDSLPPNTALVASPPARARSSTATFVFQATEAGASFACRLDGGVPEPCASPATYAGLAEGRHDFEVRATDAAGNPDPSPATHGWVVDTVPPWVEALGPPDGAGLVPSGEYVYVVFSEEMDPASLSGSTLYVNEAPGTVSLVDGRVGVWVPAASLPPGAACTATLTEGVTDLAGNPLGAARSWSFSTAAPGDVPRLHEFTLDGNRTLSAEGQAATYQFSARGGEELFVILVAGNYGDDDFTFRVRHGQHPTPTDYDFAGSASQAVQIPAALAGTYFVTVWLTHDRNYLGCCPGGSYAIGLRPYWPAWTWARDYRYAFPQAGFNLYRQCETPGGLDLALEVVPDNPLDEFTTYVRFGALPTAASYDQVGTPGSTIVIPSAPAGTYHVWMVMTRDDNFLGCCPGGALTLTPTLR